MIDQQTHNYNSITAFELNKKIHFPDFTIEHTRLKKIPGPNNAKWERRTFYFNVTGNDGSQEITWRTGVIRNTKFTVEGIEYELVMGSYPDLDSKVKSYKNLELNKLIIIKPEKVKLSKQNIKTGDIVFRSTKKKNGEVLFNEYGIIEKTILGLFVWDNRNTLKQPLSRWSSEGIDKSIAVFHIKSSDFQMNKAEMIEGSFNYLFNGTELELVSKNF
ncbi:hypothetical protein [Allomuricauda sp. F6463D]|uniref:hypothetical protein n=1 Tax=Allomuricauda sp. F6463D TaxID=2926409 RepID=UPI001FF27A7B|nr:hypothetical protein [Muricauda sp. F6463D]MCK0159436.1 hypothetical protein [Muricauda sp. F6463D]